MLAAASVCEASLGAAALCADGTNLSAGEAWPGAAVLCADGINLKISELLMEAARLAAAMGASSPAAAASSVRAGGLAFA
jgi:hypothetical protein